MIDAEILNKHEVLSHRWLAWVDICGEPSPRMDWAAGGGCGFGTDRVLNGTLHAWDRRDDGWALLVGAGVQRQETQSQHRVCAARLESLSSRAKRTVASRCAEGLARAASAWRTSWSIPR